MTKKSLSKLLWISRHLLAVLTMPFIISVIIPRWFLSTFVLNDTRWVVKPLFIFLLQSLGMVLILLGFFLFVWCTSLFVVIGRGTLAPWDPTQNLVAVGPYRHVRNPMISGVALILSGQAIFWGSWILGVWVCIFISINHIYFIFSEEPGLEIRFDGQYRLYKENVPRWLPRLKPWSGK